ncbi:MAG TPA: DUF2933 domain-containing protein [Rhodanobacter sp.]
MNVQSPLPPPSHHQPSRSGPNWSHINQWLLWLGLAAAITWLVVRHGAHLWEVLPFLILLACPLMHFFGHGGHGGHSGHQHPAEQGSSDDKTPKAAHTGPPAGGHRH